MESIVPLIGSAIPGPLGLVHLPRMWLKGLLSTVGALPDDYYFATRGFDQRLMDAVGIDAAAFVPFLQTLPTYLETEAWVRANAAKLDPASIAAANEMICTRDMPAEPAARAREAIGITDPTVTASAYLANLDDMASLHASLVRRRGEHLEAIVPAVSSLAFGPLGMMHLPRLWTKAALKTCGALPDGWRSGPPIGLDVSSAAAIGLDAAAVAEFLTSLPTYLQFEEWVVAHASEAEPATIEAHNAGLLAREKPPERAEEDREEIGTSDRSLCRAVAINDLLDWTALHTQVLARRMRAGAR
jgi:hypothetical protein